MDRLVDVVDRDLVWQQPRASKQEHELTADGAMVATLRLPRSWGSLADTATAQSSWTFKRTGFWRTTSTVRMAGSDEDLAVFDPHWTGRGELTLATGPRFRWEGTNLWATKFVWKDHLGQELVRFGAKSGLLRFGAAVEVLPAGAESADLDLLVTYGYYLLLMARQDSGAASAGVVAATSGD